ncbi:ATP-dependent RNA helicase HrpA [Vandammella animalimorsus]|uniref:ATP-dependent RNA helicase HrpA n=1 Tax=Vandammella animalimorsus TaxID=2029117 RepID=A0A2A2AWD3_9BURK|nr:ATP-dependent RNA helicase HrpA [Vandammella animalimorsus]PAT42880.1 ATP-dependent RNA helicase HrpA [Vandammella animalimorsus]
MNSDSATDSASGPSRPVRPRSGLAATPPAAPNTPAAPAAPLHINFPDSLPVSARRQEIERALRAHQVVIVCGETGSGKTTQLPKIALALGRGLGRGQRGKDGRRGQWIGHTQPRRIAASSVAKRIAEELQTPLGEVVGYKVRFNDRLGPNARVKLMTDGILLAETQTDPLLKAYDTLIIDEAHERSLNIDFLLGYLKQILPRRPDLKLIITSATIDAERFAQHFASAKGPAPVLYVSGRTYPVEIRWRPFEESRETDLNTAIADAVDELWQGRPGGDILVFLPGEREIREAADHVHKHLSHDPVRRHCTVLPLFARLSQAEQDRVFETGGPPRVVLATNVAETSLTVPGVRYVIDAGTARVKRYSYRSKVEQLLIEPISQAAANQRSGRSGRVADGVAIRLYEEADFAARARFTDPEILRSSLAGVILRMKSLGLGAVEEFPFLEAPSQRAITDGYQLLQELGAVDEQRELTEMGRQMARLPLDPRVARMLIEARARGALQEVLVVAAALSVQDVRDRPLDKQAQADQAHARFDDEKSEFTSYLKLWQWIHDARGGKAANLPSARQQAQAAAQAQGRGKAGRGHAALPVAQRAVAAPASPAAATTPAAPGPGLEGAEPAQATHRLSNRQYENLLRSHYINVRRVREWRDIHQQLAAAVAEQGWKLHEQNGPASYEALHLSLLAGLLGNVGFKPDEAEHYLGARGIKFYRHPGARLRKKPGRWVVAAELVETTRLYGRGMANIEPQWLEEVGAHLLKKQLLEPHWEQKAGEAVALERATLYGLVVYSGRRVPFARIDPATAREIMLRQALVQGDYASEWERKFPFLATNRKRIAKVEELEHKSRRQDVLVDEELIYAFYDRLIPEAVCNGRQLEQWYRQERRQQPQLLELQKDELMRHEAAGITTAAFPPTIKLAGMDLNASYLHEPGSPRDGVTVTIPLYALNQVQEARADWLVPGMLGAKVQALLKSLPQRPRSRLLPLADTAGAIASAWLEEGSFAQGDLHERLRQWVRAKTGLEIKPTDFKADMLSAHLFMNFRVVDEHGRQLGQGRNLAALKAELGQQARGAFQALAGLKLAQSEEGGKGSGEKTGEKTGETTAEKAGKDAGKNARAAAAATPTPASAAGQGRGQTPASQSESNALGEPEQRHTSWDFGELPEIMEWGKGSRKLIGFPALVDQGDAVTIEVFDEPEAAAQVHRQGLARLFALHIKDALKYLEKNIPELQKMAVAYMPLGTLEELRAQIIAVALELAFLQEPLPINAGQFEQRLKDGRPRLSLLAQEVARLAGQILAEYAQIVRKLKDMKGAEQAVADVRQQLERLMGKRFVQATPQAQLKHYPRYLKAMLMRLDKYREDPARDQARQGEIAPLEARYWKLLAQRKGQQDAALQDYRWLLEELRVSFFAQQLRTPQPVSVKRLEKVWAQVVA